MTNKNIYRTLLSIALIASCFTANAQYKVKQVLVANGGSFGSPGNMITIGSFSPVTGKYTLFDSVPGNDVTQVLVDSVFAYMATDSYLVKYDLNSLVRVKITPCKNLRYIAVYKDEIIASIGDTISPVQLKIFKKLDLSLIYTETKMSNIYCNGITVSGDSAYVALQGGYPNYNDTGRIAVEDLANQKFKRVITLDTTEKGIGDMFANGSSIVGVSEYPYSSISEINLITGAKTFILFNKGSLTSIGLPFALINDSLYAEYQNDIINGIGAFDLNAQVANFVVKPTPNYAAAALDTVNKLFYYTGGSFTKPTKTWIYNYNNKAIDSFNVGIAPEGIAIDYYKHTSGINEQNLMQANLMVYPNPSNTSLNISGIDAKNAEIKIIDITGRVLSTSTADLNDKGITNIPVSQLPQGIYFINIQSNEGFVSKEFVKN